MEAHSQPQSFVPGPENTRALRNAFGKFATGVTIVTCDSEDGPVCITANSFSSISLDPALVMWALGKGTHRYAYFEKARHFAIHVLSEQQKDLCLAASRDRFALRSHPWQPGPDGAPVIEGALARFECTTERLFDAGDHTIVLGQVDRVADRDGAALVFFNGAFDGLGA